MNKKIRLCLIALTLGLVAGCGRNTSPVTKTGSFTPETQPLPTELAGYEPMTIPADNPMTPEKIALGRQLFFDERLSIDGSMDPRGTDPRSQDLTDRRVNTVREALIQAGVPAYRIQTGTFGDEGRRRDRRVEVLISSGN